jgi:hypothetical protein
MGYVDPQQNIRTYLQTMNDQTKRFGEEFDSMFARVNQDVRGNITANIAQIEKARLKKQVGSEDYWEAYKKATPKEGYMENRNKFLKHVGELYYGISDCGTPDCEYKQRNYEGIPTKIAEVQGVYLSLKKMFDESIGAGDGIPGGFNPATSIKVMGFIDEDAKHNYDVNDDGKLVVNYKYGGVDYSMTAQEIIDLGVEGNWGVKVYGDPVSTRTEIYDGIKKKIDYDKLVSKYQGTSGRTTNQYDIYKYANDEFIKAASNPEEYKQTIEGQNGQTIMGNNWAIILNDAVDVVADPNAPSELKEKYQPYLDKILGGADGKYGGADAADDIQIPGRDQNVNFLGNENVQDYLGATATSSSDWLNFYKNQGAAGVWDVTNADMKGLAYDWFGSYNPKTNYLKGYDNKGRVLKQQVVGGKSGPSNSGGNPAQSPEEFDLMARQWLKNQTDPNTGNTVIKNRFKLLSVTPSDEAEKLSVNMQLAENEIRVEEYLNNPQTGLNSLGLPAPKNGLYKMDNNGQIYVQSVKNGKINEYYQLQQQLIDAVNNNDEAEFNTISDAIYALETSQQLTGITLSEDENVYKSSISNLITMRDQRSTKVYNQQNSGPNNPMNLTKP